MNLNDLALVGAVPYKLSNHILKLLKTATIHGMMHITGGAFTKLKDILRKNDAYIDSALLPPQKIFFDLYHKGLSNQKMYSTFNCGIGFVISLPKFDAPKALRQIPRSVVVGEVMKGNGKVCIASAFNAKTVIF